MAGPLVVVQTQVKKNLKHLRECTDPMDKFMNLSGLQDRNETIFFKLLIDHMEELGALVALRRAAVATRRC